MTQKLANKARSTLTGAITNVATSLTVQSADADLFPVATTGTSAVGTAGLDWFKIVLENNTGAYEIAYCRTRAAGVATLSNVIRGQEGTTALAFSAGDVVGLRMTKLDIENALAGVFTGWSAVQVASAGTVDIGAQTTPVVEITGTTGITSLGTNYTAGPRFLRFIGALTITHNATSLICPGGANITTSAGMTMIAVPKSTAGTADGWVIEAVSTTTTASTTPVIVPTVAANAMTLALKTLAGADPTSTAPLSINFRDSTLSSSTINTRQATAATSIVIPANATLGGANSTDAPIFVYGLDNGGTVELAVSGSNYGANFIGSTTAITSGSTSATTIYSTSARTSKPMKLLQILRSNQATAGTYTAVPVEVKYPDADAQNYIRTAVAAGSADALTAAFTAPFPSLSMAASTPLFIRAGAANATSTPTLAIDGLTAKTIVKGAGLALAAGDIQGAGNWIMVQYDLSTDKFVLMNPAKASIVADCSVPVRQTCLSGPVDSAGLPSFGGSAGGTSVTLSGTFIVTAANGFDGYGAVDRVGSITNPVFTGLSTNGTMFLYVDIAADGTCTPGTGTLAPVYQWGGSYSNTANKFTFNIQEMIGKVGSGGTSAQAYRVYLGEVIVSGGVVTTITGYALQGQYRSPEYSVATSGSATKSHNIGVIPDDVRLWVAKAAGGARYAAWGTAVGASSYPGGSAIVGVDRLTASSVLHAFAYIVDGVDSEPTVTPQYHTMIAKRGW